jgi:hypothetical protein
MSQAHTFDTPGLDAPFSLKKQSQFILVDDEDSNQRMIRIKWPRMRRPKARRRADIIETLRRAEEMECEFTMPGVGPFHF